MIIESYRRYMLISGALLVFAAVGFGQTSVILGNVKNSSGQPLKGAMILIALEESKAQYQATTDTEGNYHHFGLPIGIYTVSVVVDGNLRDSVRGVRSRQGNPVELNFDLRFAKSPSGTTGQSVASQSTDTQENIKDRLRQLETNKALITAFNEGMNALLARDFSSAVRAFERANEIDSNQMSIWAHLGEAHLGMAKDAGGLNQSKVDRGVQAYRKAVELKPDEAAFHALLGRALAMSMKFDEAELETKKAAQLDPAAAGAYWYNLGALATNANRLEEAGSAFQKASEAGYDDAHFQFGLYLFTKSTITPDGKFNPPTGTVDAFRKYVQVAPAGQYLRDACKMLSALAAPTERACQSPTTTTGAGRSQPSALPIQQGIRDSSLPAGTFHYSVYNGTTYSLTLEFAGPVNRQLLVAPGAASGATLPQGTYAVTASVPNDSNVRPLRNNKTFENGFIYTSTIAVGR